MKKVNFKYGLLALFAVLAFMFVNVQDAEAQALTTTKSLLYQDASGTFVGSAEAQDILMGQMQDLRNLAAPLTPGSPQYQAFLKTGIYYWGIYSELQNGKSVAEAIGKGLLSLNDNNGFGELSFQELNTLREGAIDLLD